MLKKTSIIPLDKLQTGNQIYKKEFPELFYLDH
jgi:hypothetical protein